MAAFIGTLAVLNHITGRFASEWWPFWIGIGGRFASEYALRQTIEKIIESKKLDQFKTKGAIALKAGIAITLIKPETPDTPERINKLKDAAKEVLGVML